jgi:soluble lytic murein transglycosylase-like protein
MSGTQVSPFGNIQNTLFDPLMAPRQQQAETNVLLSQQQAAQNDMDVVGRSATQLLNMPEDQAAAAYGPMRASLQAQGFGKNLPAEYPGHAVAQAFVNRAMTVPQQYSSGVIMPPGLADALGRITGTQPAGTGTGAAAAPGGAPGTALTPAPAGAYGQGGPNNAQVPAEYMPFYQEASQRTGIPVDVLIAQSRQESGFNPNATGRAGEIGIGQIMPATARSPGYGVAPVDPATLRDPRTNINFQADYLRAHIPPGMNPSDPEAIRRALVAYNGGGDRNYVANVTRYIPPPGGGTATATAASPTAPAGGGGQPGSYQTASNAPTPPPGSTAAPGAPTGGAVPVTTPASPAGAPVAQNTLVPPAPQRPQVAPAPAAATGVNSPQFQQALALQNQALQLETSYPNSPQAKAAAAALRQRAQAILQTGQWVQQPDGSWVNTISGEPKADVRPDVKQTMTGDGIVETDAKTGQVIRTIPASPTASPRFSPPTVDPDTGKPAIAAVGPGGRTTYFPIPERPAGGTWELQKEDYQKDQPQLTAAAEQAQNARTSQIRWQTMLDLANKLTTGAGGATRTQLANLAETAGFPGVAQSLIANSSAGDASAAQEFTKLATQAAGADARADLGSRAGLGAIRLFQSANPNLDLRPGANKGIIGMQLIAAQADADYNNAKLGYGNQQAQNLRDGKGYQPLSTFDQQWQTQRNPQVYAAAMGALQGQPYEQWTRGLQQPEIERALDVVSRASPNATVNGKAGRLNMQPGGQAQSNAPTVGTVQQGYRFKGGDPSNQANWDRVQ